MNNKRKCFLAYTAGLIDGEGYIAVGKGINRNGKIYYKPYIGINMTDAISLAVIKHFFPDFRFAIKKNYNYSDGINRKQIYRLELDSTDKCINLLKAIKPYLFVKYEQAKIMLSYLALRSKQRYIVSNQYSSEKEKKSWEKYTRKSKKYYDLLKVKKQEPSNGMKTVELLNQMDLRQYCAKLEDVEKLRKEVRNLLEGAETRVRQSTVNKPASVPEQDIVQS